MNVGEIHRSLGIPAGYGTLPFRPRYREAGELIAVGTDVSGCPQLLAAEAAGAWQDMRDAARRDQVDIHLISGFRSVDRQAALIRRKLEAGFDIDAVLDVIAAPGFSQHHTGQALDLSTPGCEPLDERFENTAAFAWLQDRAGDFGFSLSYPRGNPFGFVYEPWHWAHAAVVRSESVPSHTSRESAAP